MPQKLMCPSVKGFEAHAHVRVGVNQNSLLHNVSNGLPMHEMRLSSIQSEDSHIGFIYAHMCTFARMVASQGREAAGRHQLQRLHKQILYNTVLYYEILFQYYTILPCTILYYHNLLPKHSTLLSYIILFSTIRFHMAIPATLYYDIIPPDQAVPIDHYTIYNTTMLYYAILYNAILY